MLSKLNRGKVARAAAVGVGMLAVAGLLWLTPTQARVTLPPEAANCLTVVPATGGVGTARTRLLARAEVERRRVQAGQARGGYQVPVDSHLNPAGK